MTPTQPTPGLRERVAELMGVQTRYWRAHWDRMGRAKSLDRIRTRARAESYLGRAEAWIEEYTDLDAIPDYPGDLNHAHAAVRALITTREQWRDFLGHLEDITKAKEFDDWVDCLKCAIFATPEQVCTALLRTLGGEEGV